MVRVGEEGKYLPVGWKVWKDDDDDYDSNMQVGWDVWRGRERRNGARCERYCCIDGISADSNSNSKSNEPGCN